MCFEGAGRKAGSYYFEAVGRGVVPPQHWRETYLAAPWTQETADGSSSTNAERQLKSTSIITHAKLRFSIVRL